MTRIEMENILSKMYYRKHFFIIIILIIIVLLFIRFYILPSFDCNLKINSLTFISILLDNFVIALFVTVFVGTLIFWLTPQIVRKSVMSVIAPKEIGLLFNKAMCDTKTWLFKGACGRFTRTKTLPELALNAKKEGIGKDITLCLIDPKDKKICEEYSIYKKSLSKNENIWTVEKVREEVISTILVTLKYRHDEPLLRINLFLIKSFSSFRFDISDSYVIVTKEDKEVPGLKADKGTYFYDSYVDDIKLTQRQGRDITFSDTIDYIDTNEIRNLITKLDLLEISDITENLVENIKTTIQKNENPYK